MVSDPTFLNGKRYFCSLRACLRYADSSGFSGSDIAVSLHVNVLSSLSLLNKSETTSSSMASRGSKLLSLSFNLLNMSFIKVIVGSQDFFNSWVFFSGSSLRSFLRFDKLLHWLSFFFQILVIGTCFYALPPFLIKAGSKCNWLFPQGS